jgi:predicted methyltransferase
MTVTERTTRTCDKCSVADSHAHHIQFIGIIHPITQEGIDLSVSKHIQCCAASGCASCSTHVEFAPDKSIGEKFNAFVQAPSIEHQLALFERHGIVTPESKAAAAAAPTETEVEGV